MAAPTPGDPAGAVAATSLAAVPPPTTAADPAALAAATEAVELAAQAAEEASLAATLEQAELPSERGGTRPAGMRGLEVLHHGDRSVDWAVYFVDFLTGADIVCWAMADHASLAGWAALEPG